MRASSEKSPGCASFSKARTRAKTTRDDAALLAGFRTEVIEDRVYLLTPKGQVIDLPRGATVLDFAYSIHTDVGHRCRGAKVNGRIVPLTFQPASGDRIEILTGKTIEPRRDWLSPHHGYLATHRAREKVRTWFKRVDHAAESRRRSRVARSRAQAPRAASREHRRCCPRRFQLRTQEELLEALALGDISPGQVARALHESLAPPSAADAHPRPRRRARRCTAGMRSSSRASAI